MPNIMAQLPNHLIMEIIKLADGGLNTHKQKFKSVMDQFKLFDQGENESTIDLYNDGCAIAEIFELGQYLPKCVTRCEGYYGQDYYCVDEHHSEFGTTVDDEEYAKKWVNRLNPAGCS